MNIRTSLPALIGHTPLFSPRRFCEARGLSCNLLCKLESFNPAGSVKDRVALFMLDTAERDGRIIAGKEATIIEPTSGNTGIGLCALAAARGYHAIIVMPDNMSAERIRLMQAYGAEVILTPAALGMQGAIQKAKEIAAITPNSFIPDQFENPANPAAHYATTGPEIFEDTDGRLDYFIAGVGTGGTLSGTGRYLKERLPALRVIAVEPASSPLLSMGVAGPHGLQGIGANFIPNTLDQSIYDEILPITEEQAYDAARLFAHTEGILVGISSGAALAAAVALARREALCADHTLVALLPDGGDRYLTTDLYSK